MLSEDVVIKLSNRQNACHGCGALSYCLPAKLNKIELSEFEQIVRHRRTLQRGERLFFAGEKFKALYIVHSGSVKSYVNSNDGEYQITGFYFLGELLGLDGIEHGVHATSVEALETTSICEISFKSFEMLSKKQPQLQPRFIKLFSHAVASENELVLMLGKKTAEQRVANFLLDISSRMQLRGQSSKDINLSMSRNDVANYLGLAIETVSRILTRFQANGFLKVHYRNLSILNHKQLLHMANRESEKEYAWAIDESA